MPADFMPNPTDLIRILPEIVLTVMGVVLMLLDPLLRKRSSNAFGNLTIAALAAALAAAVYAYADEGPAFGGMIVVDGFATFFRAARHGGGHPHRAGLLPLSAPADDRRRRRSPGSERCHSAVSSVPHHGAYSG